MEHPDLQGLSDWRLLARGRTGLVWQARQGAVGRSVAVKVYHSEVVERGRDGLPLEAVIAGRLSDHHGVVTTHGAGLLPDGRPYLVMELCPGGSLACGLTSGARPTASQVRQVGLRLADTLVAVHACGLVHRNVSPGNILIDDFGHPRLADFGVADVTGVAATAAQILRMDSPYVAPELLEMRPATPSADVFSLAATLYALLTGGAPRRLDDADAWAQPASVGTGPTESSVSLDAAWMDVVTTALSNDSTARPTAAELRDHLAKVRVTDWGVRGPSHGGAEESSPTRRRVLSSPSLPAAPPSGRLVAARVASPGRWSHGIETSAPAAPLRRTGRASILAAAAAVLIGLGSVTVWRVGEPLTSGAPVPTTLGASSEPSSIGGPSSAPRPRTADSTPAARTGGSDDRGPAVPAIIEVAHAPDSAKPFQTVELLGRYVGGADTVVRVQHWTKGEWLDFPLPVKTDEVGEFSAYVELGEPSSYRLRVADVDTGVMSKPVLLVIKG